MSTEAARPSRCDHHVTKVNDNDVQLGRGRPVITSQGNLRFRRLILEHRVEYTSTTRHNVKDGIARRILSTIAVRGGRFLRRLESASERELLGMQDGDQAWATVDDETSLQKVKQALREQESAAGVDSEGLKGSLSGKKRQSATTDASTIVDAALVVGVPTSKKRVAAPARPNCAMASLSRSTASLPTAPLKEPAGFPKEASTSHVQDTHSVDNSSSQEDLELLFRLKHPSLRKRDLLRSRRQQVMSQQSDLRIEVARFAEGKLAQLPSSVMRVESMRGHRGVHGSTITKPDDSSKIVRGSRDCVGVAALKVVDFSAPSEDSKE